MHNVDEILADLARLEHKRELAVQAQRERDRQPVHFTGKQLLRAFFASAAALAVTIWIIYKVFELGAR
jgi:hypothetical protein